MRGTGVVSYVVNSAIITVQQLSLKSLSPSVYIFLHISEIGTFTFDASLGLYEDAPKQEAQRFTLQVKIFLNLLLKFNIASTVAGKFIDKFAFKKFLKCGDAAFEISQGFQLTRK